jgi:hypothetical protein
MQAHHTVDEADSQSGAILILALVMMMLASLTIAGLLQWANTNLSNVTNYQTGVTNQQSADAAVDIAVQDAGNANDGCPPFGSSVAPDGTVANNPLVELAKNTTASTSSKLVNVDVWCTTASEQNSNGYGNGSPTLLNWTDSFAACPIVQSAVMSNCSETAPYLSATVSFVASNGATGYNETIVTWSFSSQ